MKRLILSTIFSWLMNLAYCGLLLVIAPVLAYRSCMQGKYRTGWNEKLWGNLPDWFPTIGAGGQQVPRYWFHAVSVGEVLLLQSVLAELQRRVPQAEILITTTTATGQGVAREKYPQLRHAYCPLDFSWAVHNAFQRIRPTHFVLVELELWPNMVLAAKRSGAKLMLINGRLSERSFRGYARLRGLMQFLLGQFDMIAAQSETYAQRFLKLGAPTDRVHVTGSVKFDRVQTDRHQPLTRELRTAFGLQAGEPVFIAGSTQSPEEQIAINVWQAARQTCPSLRLILVPRHKERFDEVARLVEQLQVPLLRRSATRTGTTASNSNAVLLLDTLGELTACWGLADFAFVGGSLTNRGGQNMIEPAGYGAAVCFGPNTKHFRDIVEALLDRQAAIVVADEAALTNQLREWLSSPDTAHELGQRAQQFVLTQRGASGRTIELLTSDISAPRGALQLRDAA